VGAVRVEPGKCAYANQPTRDCLHSLELHCSGCCFVVDRKEGSCGGNNIRVILCAHRVEKSIGMMAPSRQSSPSARGRGGQAITFGAATLRA
jgi:hypothetical protein